jgi:ABC-type transporter Mla subunit MlaD
MKRSSFITWDQLKVGVLILVALVIIAAAIVKLGAAGNLFGKRYRLVAFVASASGLRIRGQVTVGSK